nr:hypothetical protein [Tanacetum cinerariifolium]
MRTKPGVDTLSFDDLYNNLRVFEFDVKGSTASSSSTQNVAFVSSNSTSSTNEVSTAYGVSISFGHNLQKEGSSSYTNDLIEGVDWTGHAEDDTKNYSLVAFSSNNSGLETEMSAKEKSGLGYGNQIHKGVLSYENKVLESVFDSRSSDVEDSPVNDRFVKVEGMHAVPPLMTGIYMPPKSDFGIDESKFTYGPKQSKTSESNVKTNNLNSSESNSSEETLEFVPKPDKSKSKAVSEPKVWSDAPIIEEYKSENDDEYVFKASMEQEKTKYQDFNGGHVAFGGSKGQITDSFLPNTFWAEAVSTGCYVLNRPVTAENKANKTVGPKEANNSVAITLRKTFAISTKDLLLQAGAARANSTNNIPSLEDIYEVPNDGIFTSASYDDEGAVEPKKISQVLEDESWVDAMQEELLNKKDERGVLVRNKARLVAQGHRQEEGIEYDEVFALVARIEVIRICLAFASYMGFIVYQMDVKSAFLYGKIDKKVFQMSSMGELTFFLGLQTASTPIKTKKQTIVATSTTEAEYVAAATYCGQILWIQNQMQKVSTVRPKLNNARQKFV